MRSAAIFEEWVGQEDGKVVVRKLDPVNLGVGEDWEGNNAAIACPVCSKVYIISALIHVSPTGEKGYRKCPKCEQSIGRVSGGRKSDGTASIEWDE